MTAGNPVVLRRVSDLIRKHGSLLVTTAIREERHEGSRRWALTVTLRYPTGHEGYVGDLLYGGKGFAFITPPEVMREREGQIATGPAL